MNHLHAIRYFEQVLSVKFWSICQMYINFFVFLIRSPTRLRLKKWIIYAKFHEGLSEIVKLVKFVTSFRVFLCNAKRHPDSWTLIRNSQLFVLLCQHFPLGNLSRSQMERRQWPDQRKNRIGHSKCYSGLSLEFLIDFFSGIIFIFCLGDDGYGQAFLHFFCCQG